MQAGFVIEGAKELERQLDQLGRKVAQRVVRRAVRAAQEPLLQRARANARTTVGGQMGGLIASNIVKRAAKRQQPGTYSIHVQIRDGIKELTHTSRSGKQSFIPAAVEYGHGADKSSAARPFMRPAADTTKDEAMRILARELRTGILREAICARSR